MINKTAIICHGPSLQKSGIGQYIDSFKYVLRFPYLKAWQVSEDYGVKTSYFCGTVGRFMRCQTRIALQPTEYGYFIWSKEVRKKIPASCKNLIQKYGGADVTGLIESWRKKLTKCHHPFFTHGTSAICIAANKLKIPIVVFGADVLKTGEVPSEYIGSWTYENRRPRKIGHPIDQERKLIDEMANHYYLEITFK
jgi:hypothetical protein